MASEGGKGGTIDPINPMRADQPIITMRCTKRSCVLHNGNPNAVPRPMVAPPAMAARRPRIVMPPFVPGGTGLNVVIKKGGDFERMPSSEDQVSAFAAA
jgi:hypothetical protein